MQPLASNADLPPRNSVPTQQSSIAKQPALLTPVEALVLDLNKLGMQHLARQQPREAAQYLKKAEATIIEQVSFSDKKDQGLNRLLGITLNNLGCYYKKTNKPKVALKYLKQALEIEVYNVEDWISTAGTHLNICAIFSFLNKHKQAADHAHLSIRLLERESQRSTEENNASLNNVLIVSYYNLGVELEHLRNHYESRDAYEKGLELTKQTNKLQNMNMAKILEQNVKRLNSILQAKEKKQYNLQQRKREQQIAGHYDYMRKHKRKSFMREDYASNNKRFPSYMKSNYRSSSIGDISSVKVVSEKQRSQGKIKREEKSAKGMIF